MNTDLNTITGLDVARFEKARRAAEEQVRASVPQPDMARYTTSEYNPFPAGLRRVVLLAMIAGAALLFWISAGKAIMIADLTFGPLLHDTARLSPFWLDITLVAFIVVGEIFTLAFMAGRAMFKSPLLAVFGVASASGALLANISVTALHPETIAAFPVFGWFAAIFPPLGVLGIGYFFEKMLLSSLEARGKARAAYESALETWREAQESPAASPEYPRALALAIWDQLQRISPANRAKIAAAIEADPGVRLALVRREIARHEWASADVFTVQVVQETRLEQPNRPALPEGVHADADGANGHGQVSLNALNTASGPAVQRALAWLESQPERPANVREAAALAGVSVGTMHAALKASANGHGPQGA